jgi:hypothetical protein
MKQPEFISVSYLSQKPSKKPARKQLEADRKQGYFLLASFGLHFYAEDECHMIPPQRQLTFIGLHGVISLYI